MEEEKISLISLYLLFIFAFQHSNSNERLFLKNTSWLEIIFHFLAICEIS